MSVNLLRGAAAGATSPELVIRPGRSNAFPMTVTADGPFGALVDIYVSPTNQSLTDWTLLFSLSCPAAGSAYNEILYPWERVKAVASPMNGAGLVNCNLEPGA